MGKFYSQYRRPPRKERPWRVHPIWRGIGCFLAILIPFFAFAVGDLLIQANFERGWVVILFDLIGLAFSPLLYAKLIMTVVVSAALFGMLTFVYAIVYRVVGPPRYSRIDAPPMRRRPRSRKKNRR